jgi:hypothetical protein
MVSSRRPSLRSFALKAFYLAFPKVQTLSGLLSWSHYVELLSIDDTLEQGSLGVRCFIATFLPVPPYARI